MTEQGLETIFEALSAAIDQVGPDQSEVFLAKVALALSDTFSDSQIVLDIFKECQTGLSKRV